MITTLESGFYKLIETKSNVKILYLDKNIYAWVEPNNFGEMLVVSHRSHRTDCVLSTGQYNLYEVVNEPSLTDLKHLELEVGSNTWQGYLLLTGLPNKTKKRARIIPTNETITKNSKHAQAKIDQDKLVKMP